MIAAAAKYGRCVQMGLSVIAARTQLAIQRLKEGLSAMSFLPDASAAT